MRHISIDTNVYSVFKKGDTRIIEIIQNVDTISIDIIAIAELLAGFKNGTFEKRNRQDLIEFLNNNRVEVMDHDTDTAEFYAHIYSVLRKKDTPIPTNDIWIAASSAMQHGHAFLSLDTHFREIDGLLLVPEEKAQFLRAYALTNL